MSDGGRRPPQIERSQSNGELVKQWRESRRRSSEAACSQMKALFRQWDRDGNGIISRNELMMIVRGLGVVSQDDVDMLMEEADKDGNGAIDFHEFVEWLMRPGSHVSRKDNRVVLFDIDAALRPLFNVYDRDRSGYITREEFSECHTILSNSLRMCPKEDGEAPDPAVIMKDAESVFSGIDFNNDRQICFAEFVQWQRRAIEKSGLTNEDLKELVSSLARSLQGVFKLEEAHGKGGISEADTSCLERIIENLATHARNLWNTQKAGVLEHPKSTTKYSNIWSEPPIGLNIEKLKHAHLRFVPINMCGVTKVTVGVFCVPEKPRREVAHGDEKVLEERRWLAEVTRKVTRKEKWTYKKRQTQQAQANSALAWCQAREALKEESFPIEHTEPSYYYEFTKDSLSWARAENGAKDFEKAVKSMAPEMRIFCILKTEANFGVSIGWDQIQAALQTAVDLDLMDEEQHLEFTQHMEGLVLKMMTEEDMLSDLNSPTADRKIDEKKLEEHVSEELRRRITLAPRAVMATLSELGIVRISDVWSHFMD